MMAVIYEERNIIKNLKKLILKSKKFDAVFKKKNYIYLYINVKVGS